MLSEAIKFFRHGGRVILIETNTSTLYIDVFERDEITPADLSGATVFFHLMEFSTRENIWSKECFPVYDPNVGVPKINYPYTVPVTFSSPDTLNLEGHYTGQLELIDYRGESTFPFEIEIIVRKKASA